MRNYRNTGTVIMSSIVFKIRAYIANSSFTKTWLTNFIFIIYRANKDPSLHLPSPSPRRHFPVAPTLLAGERIDATRSRRRRGVGEGWLGPGSVVHACGK